MRIKVSSSDGNPLHLWSYEKFKEHYHAILVDYETYKGMIINHIIYEIQEDTIDLSYANENGFKVEILS